jgi:hypothetical protein
MRILSQGVIFRRRPIFRDDTGTGFRRWWTGDLWCDARLDQPYSQAVVTCGENNSCVLENVLVMVSDQLRMAMARESQSRDWQSEGGAKTLETEADT